MRGSRPIMFVKSCGSYKAGYGLQLDSSEAATLVKRGSPYIAKIIIEVNNNKWIGASLEQLEGAQSFFFEPSQNFNSDGYKTILACDPLNNDGRQKR